MTNHEKSQFYKVSTTLNFRDDIRDQISSLKKEYQKDKRAKGALNSQSEKKDEATISGEIVNAEPSNKMFQQYLSEQRKYADRKRDVPKKKDAAHEQQTLDLLARFKSKLNQAMYASSEDEDDDGKLAKQSTATTDGISSATAVRAITSDNEDDIAGDDWLSHTLRFEEKAPVLAKDASTKKDDWYDAFDPRNPLNKRKRGGDEADGRNSSRHQRRGGEGGGNSSRRTGSGGGGGGSNSGKR